MQDEKQLAAYAEQLHRRNSEQLGFIPAPRLRWYADRQQIIPEFEGGELCGYLIWGIGWPWFRIYQACVEYDVRWLGHGRNLVSAAKNIANAQRCSAITLGCRQSNAATDFWQALGFSVLGTRPGGQRRGREIVQFVMWLDGQRHMLL